MTIAVGASAITALSAFFGSLAARGDKGAWRSTQLEIAHAFTSNVDRALRDVDQAIINHQPEGVSGPSLASAEQRLELVAAAHLHVLLVYGSGSRGQCATRAYERLKDSRDALGQLERSRSQSDDKEAEAASLADIKAALEESRASLSKFTEQAARSIRGRRPLRLVPNALLDALSHDAGIRQERSERRRASGRSTLG